MTIEERRAGGVLVLSMTGDITMKASGTDAGVADRVRRAVQNGDRRLLLDMGRVRYVDSAGLGDLVQAYAAARNRGGAMKLLSLTKRVNDLLILTRLLTLFECFDDETEALASFGEPAPAQPE